LISSTYAGNATGVPHATTKDDYYLGRLIPKGAGVIPNLTALHGDSELYPNPDVFEPDRFKNHHLDAAASATHPDYLQRDHFNYGFGRRLCPGIHIAEQSLFIVISRVLWGFDIRMKPGQTLDMSSKSSMLWHSNGAGLSTDDLL
jgi:cytochrome P450